MAYQYIKALHIIFVVTWFAGLFYIPRLFINQIEAYGREEPGRSILTQHLKLMTRRLWLIITWPSAILCTLTALGLLLLVPSLLQQTWMLIKLGFVLLLFVYHGRCHLMYLQLQRDEIRYTSHYMRIWNEVPTLVLFAAVFLVVLKSSLYWVYGVLGLFALAVLIMLGVRWYKRVRLRRDDI